MKKRKLAYIWSLRNAAADKAGQYVPYKGEERYMKSVLESLVEGLNQTSLGFEATYVARRQTRAGPGFTYR